MATFNSGTNQAGGQQTTTNPWLAFAAGNLTGAVADQGVALVQKTVADAKWGKWLGIGNTLIGAYCGNGATSPINAAAIASNKIVAGGTYSQADATNQKAFNQNVVTALQSLNPLQALGISDKTANTATPSETPASSTASGVSLVVAVAAGAVIGKLLSN